MTIHDTARGRTYYPALDGLRFVAISLVYLFHRGVPQLASGIDALARWFGYAPKTATGAPWSPGNAILDNGWVGVQLFFILSGFLITTLLLREEARDGRVDLRAFWMRRILRIWPLYYMILILTFFVLPGLDGAWGQPSTRALWIKHLPAFALFAGNWSMAIVGPVPYDFISVLWSVCVEEQFYLFCPLLVAWVRPSRRVGCVVAMMAFGIAARAITAEALRRQAVTPLFFQYSTFTQLDTLLAGVMLALIRERRSEPMPRWAVHSWELFAIGCGIALLARPGLAKGGVAGSTLDFVSIWAVGTMLVAVSASEYAWIARILRYDRFVWLGRISYGLYMYHEIAFWMQRGLFDWIGWFPNNEELAPFLKLALTIGLAAGSYYWLERPFLRMKARWSKVASRPV